MIGGLAKHINEMSKEITHEEASRLPTDLGNRDAIALAMEQERAKLASFLWSKEVEERHGTRHGQH